MTGIDVGYIDKKIEEAFAEDLGTADITTDAVFHESFEIGAAIIARQEGIIAGTEIVSRVFAFLDNNLTVKIQMPDGATCVNGDTIILLRGDGRSILKGERTALNFLGWLSGIASMTGRYVKLVQDTHAEILDTRKTHPQMRILEKYAVKMGGGRNHRMGLFDMYLIKDNHLLGAGDIGRAIDLCSEHRKQNNSERLIEVEVEDLNGLKIALAHHADIILLDNMPPEVMRKAVEITAGRAKLEASGGITETTVCAAAESGVDYISIGALTHSAPNMDFSMEFEEKK